MNPTINPEDVELFLRENPDFLQNRPALLAALNLPHGGEGAVSLVERQVAILRERNITSRQKLVELSEIGRENDRLLEAARQTILALLNTVDRGHATLIWSEQACGTFGAEMGTLVWFGSAPQGEGAESVVRQLTQDKGTFSGPVSASDMDELFGRGAAKGSAAVSCIRKGEEIIGALTVGASDTERYRREDGTLFLDYIAEVIGQLPACQ
ncbi:MAG: DUF484 family protein [Halieaceae bacterium]